MLRLKKPLLVLALLLCSKIGLLAQDRLVVVQAESGALGSDFVTASADGVTYITAGTDFNGSAGNAAPGIADKVATYTITFPQAGTYAFYARIRVGAGGGNDDSFYWANAFGTRDVLQGNQWITHNNFPNVGYTAPGDVVLSGGNVPNQTWKWIRFSGANLGENGPNLVVPAGNLTQVFQIGTRENGLDFDQIAFGLVGNNFTVANLLNIAPVVTAGQAFTTYAGAVNGDHVGLVVGTDSDPGTTLQDWAIAGGSGAAVFAINPATGHLTVADASAIDPINTPSYTLSVTTRDGLLTSAAETVTINAISPSGLTVINQPAPGSYKAGDVLSFDVAFDGPLTVNASGGTPRLAVAIGIQTRFADYVSGSGTNRLNFAHTILAGDDDTDGIALVSPLQLNGGEIKDGSNNDIDLTFTPPDTSNILVDSTPPDAPSVGGYLDATRVLTGTAEAGSTIDVYLDGVLNGAALTNGLGNWSLVLDVSQLASGSHNISATATATDAVGNVSPVSGGFPIVVVIDPHVPLVVQAESGVLGSDFASLTAGAVGYITALTDLLTVPNAQSPGSANKVATYSVTFPQAGTYDLYVRLRVGPGNAGDDSFYYGNGFGTMDFTNPDHWITVNNINNIGFTANNDWVTNAGSVWGAGGAGTNTFKWLKLSFNNTDELGIQFVVPEGQRTQTFQIGTRENGLDIDQFVFGLSGVHFTVDRLNSVVAGTTTPPPEPYMPDHPPLATGKPKFLGSAFNPGSAAQNASFNAYFNQITPENAGKWGSVEGTRDVMNWGGLDNVYNFAKAQGIPFRFHILVWGNQQPTWMEPNAIPQLTAAEKLEEIEEWFSLVAARYPDIDFLEVVNEPLHDPPTANNGNYIDALGGTDGTDGTGWDWVINAFRIARKYFPNTPLMINEYSVENDGNMMTRYIELIKLLQDRDLIDMVGIQGHAFSLTGSAATLKNNLDRLAAETGLPIQITEFDIDGTDENFQASEYMRVFPTFWEHPAVTGITLWGYRAPNHWRNAQGAAIVYANGAEEPSMLWLKDYVRAANPPLQPFITGQPEDASAFVGETVSFTVKVIGNPLPSIQWQTSADGGESWTDVVDNATFSGSTTDTLVATGVTYALNGSLFRAVASNASGPEATSDPAIFTVNVAVTAHVRHAPVIDGRVEGSVQMLSGENVSLPGSARITGHLLVPGTPNVSVSTDAIYGGTFDGLGSESPTGYSITIDAGASVGHVIRRIDPVDLSTVATPPSPMGTVDVTVNKANQTVDFTTLRNLTVNSNGGSIAVPEGTYGTFAAIKNTSLTLGEAGSEEARVYNLQGLTLNNGAKINIVGPVILNVRNSVTLNSASVGTNANPEWLLLGISDGSLTINNGSTVNGFVVAPTGTVTIGGNSTLHGGVESDGLAIHSKGVLKHAE